MYYKIRAYVTHVTIVIVFIFLQPVNAQINKSFEFDVDGVLPSTDPDIEFFTTGAAETTVYSVSNGLLEQRTLAHDGNFSYTFPNTSLTGGGLDSSKSFSMEVRLKILNIEGFSSPFFEIFDGAHDFGLFFQSPDSVLFSPAPITPGEDSVILSDEIPGFNIADFHTYRIESPGNSSAFNLVVDGQLVFSGTAQPLTTLNGFEWGDGFSVPGNGSDVDWDFVRFSQPAQLDGDHYLSYDVKEMKGTPKFEKRDVTLADQFETGIFEVKKLKALYNPVDKNGEGIIDPNTHLVGYEIKRDKDEPKHVKQTNIQVDNQFGTLIVDTKKPDRLLVPSAKSLTGPVGALPVPLTVDHFNCYKVKVTEGTPEFVPLQVTLEDQFTAPRVFDVDKPTRLCNPVDKNGEGILNPELHLLCYKVKPAKDEPKHEKIESIHVNNQFGPLQVDTKKEKELCVPSTKTLP